MELGVKFTSSAAGTVVGVQFYKGVGNTGTHVGNMWSASGTNLASVTFTGETATGWQQANFATPVTITAGTTYVVSYHTNVGHYADDQGFFNAALNVAPLSAPVNAGVFKYGSSSGFPTSAWNASNYWVQPVVSTGPPPPPALSAVSVSPTSVVGGSPSTGTVTLTSPASASAVLVSLTSSNTSVAIVPVSVNVAANATSGAFPATTLAVASLTPVTITASYAGVNKTATLTVNPPPPVTVTISPTSTSLAPGGTQQFTATVTGTTTTTVTWTATGGTVSNGLYTAGSTTGTFSVTATSTADTTKSASATVTVTNSGGLIPHTLWSVAFVDSQETSCANGAAVNAIDGNPSTKWHTQYCPSSAPLPHEIQINLGALYLLNAFQYLPRQDGCSHGWIKQYAFYVSTDGVNWGTAVATGTFSYGSLSTTCPAAGVPAAIQVAFPSTTGQYIRLQALSEINGNPWTSAAEINAIGAMTAPAPTWSLSGSLSPASYGNGTTLTLGGLTTATTTADTLGNYSFSALTNGTYSVTPSKSGYVFSPTVQSATISGANATVASFTVSVAPPPPVAVSISPTAATIASGGTQQFTATVTGTTNTAVTWTATDGTVTSGLYTAPATAGTYTVTATSMADTTKSASATVTVTTSNVIFYDNFTGTTLNSNWTVISRHGEYSQNETECNVPQMVSVNNGLTITTEAQSATCGDYFTAPSSWPYITGDIQWTNLNFMYGTVEIMAKFPSVNTSLWPATWMLSSNCQYTNPLTGSTGITIDGHTCPNIGESGYHEIDMTECYTSSGWCQFHVANPGFGIGGGCDVVGGKYTVDTNFHLFTTVWTSSSIKQYMDGNLVATCNQKISSPMFLIIQTQTGGVGGTPNKAYLPATLQVSYVRVTQP